MPDGLTLTKKIHFSTATKGKRHINPGPAPAVIPHRGRVPRVARLMALAVKFDGLIAGGQMRDQAQLAQLGHVTRARVTQIMKLLYLAPDIQEAILHLDPVMSGKDPITEREIRALAAEPDWKTQRRRWRQITASLSP